MPKLISRDEALARIREECGTPACLMCAIRDGRAGKTVLVADEGDVMLVLPRYVRRWGHAMAMPKPHVTSFVEVDDALWERTNVMALRAARMIERLRRPRRCYLASTGSSAGELTQTSVHLHIHVIPLYQPDDKPADIFSWSGGVYVADDEEWEELRSAYVEGMRETR
jgi:diadenosine tetraphosphate (Ap4A) HIT family hydrolase